MNYGRRFNKNEYRGEKLITGNFSIRRQFGYLLRENERHTCYTYYLRFNKYS